MRPLEEPTPILHPKRIITYQLRPDGRLLMGRALSGLKLDQHA